MSVTAVLRSGPPWPCAPAPFVSDVLGVGRSREDEDPVAAVRRPDVRSAYATPPRVIPELGQVPENTSKCSQNRPPPASSHTSRAGFQAAIRFAAMRATHVLPYD